MQRSRWLQSLCPNQVQHPAPSRSAAPATTAFHGPAEPGSYGAAHSEQPGTPPAPECTSPEGTPEQRNVTTQPNCITECEKHPEENQEKQSSGLTLC